MVPDLAPYAIAVSGVTGMLMMWLLVQRAWSRVFDAGDTDVLAGRDDCHGCTLTEQCASTHCAARSGD